MWHKTFIFRQIACCTFCVVLLIIANHQAWRLHYTDTHQSIKQYYATTSEAEPFLTIAILTAPRPNHAAHLLATISSLIDKYRAYAFYEPSAKKVELLVLNHHAEENRIFQAMKVAFKSNIEREQVFMYHNQIVEGGKVLNMPIHVVEKNDKLDSADILEKQRYHTISLLKEAKKLNNSTYIMILEDDFPLCDKVTFWDIMHALEQVSSIRRPDGKPNCAAFFATGGSGLALRRDTSLDMVIELLESRKYDKPHDNVMQNCLLGDYKECGYCKSRFWITGGLYFRHIGSGSSTIEQREVAPDKWQCGWRGPFTDRSDVRIAERYQPLSWL